MIVAGTGHRPNKLGGYDDRITLRLTGLAKRHLGDAKTVISGMALGWDTAVALAAIELGKPLICAVPFDGQEKAWPSSAQKRFNSILELAHEVVIVSPGEYAHWKMHARNKWMVHRADVMLALWDGSSGGTGSCLAVADGKSRPVFNVWKEWEKIR